MLLAWAFLSAILIALFTMAVIGLIPLGPQFTKAVIASWVLALLMGCLVTVITEVRTAKANSSARQAVLKGRHFIILIVFGILLAAIVVTIGIIEREIAENRNESKAESAKSRFAISFYLGTGPEFDKESVEQTLAELEDSYLQMEDTWVIPEDASRINVALFRDLQAYSEMTQQDDAAGHVWCPPDQGPFIAIP